MHIPLGNSLFQIQNFIVIGPPERKLRTCILQLRQKETALKECQFRRRKLEIDKQEKLEKLKTASGYSKKRLEIALERIEFHMENERELIADCLVEIQTYKTIMKDLPEITRQQFEDAEYDYWKERLLKDAQHEFISMGTVTKGTIDALEQMGIFVKRNKENQITYEERQLLKEGGN